MTLTIGSLFSGIIGGLELGLEWAGLGPVLWQCEIDPFCRQVLAKHWPKVTRYQDVDEVHGMKLKKLTEEQAVESVARYEAGESLQAIGRSYGVSRQSMWDLLRRRTTMRSQLRHGADNHFFRGGSLEDDRAHDLVEKAVLRGDLVRPPSCATCGSAGRMSDGRTSIQAHHDDYNAPLKVRWLCQVCHHEWHRTHKAIVRKEVPTELPAVDLICGGFP